VRPPSVMAAVIVSALSACSSASTQIGKGPRPASANEVVISGYKFVPQTLTVPVGTTVTWVNRDIAHHTVTRRFWGDEPFDSGKLSYQGAFSQYRSGPRGATATAASPTQACKVRVVVQ
jgi:plastocyanin